MGDYYKEILIGSEVLVNEQRFIEICMLDVLKRNPDTKASREHTLTYKVHKTLEIQDTK